MPHQRILRAQRIHDGQTAVVVVVVTSWGRSVGIRGNHRQLVDNAGV